MPMYYRRPGVYLEESLLVNPSDVAGTYTVGAFVGAAEKGPVNEPVLVESWSDYVTIFGGMNPITQPAGADPNNVTSRLTAPVPANLAALKAHATYGDTKYQTPFGGAAFTAGQYAVLTDQSKAHFTPHTSAGVWVAGAFPGTPAAIPASPKVLSYLPFAVYSFFQNGGRVTWVIRATPTSAPEKGIASTIAVNGADAGQGNLTAFTLKARSPGVWGNGLKYGLATQSTVGAGATAQDVFALQILMRNSEGNDEVVETFPSLSIGGEIPGTRRIDTVLNDSVAGSLYVSVSGVNESQPRPVATTNPVSLAGGTDPAIPDAGDLQDAAQQITKVEGPIALNIVGLLADASKAETAEFASAWVGATIPSTQFSDRQDIFIVNDSAPPRNPGTASSVYRTQIQTALGANTGDSYSASYGPWLIIPNPSRVGTTISVPPGGAVMGMMARIDATVGVFRAPAGVIAGLTNAVGVQTKFTDTELGDLNSQNINITRSVVGSGICVMGGRTRKTYGADRYVSARRTLIYIKEVLKRSTQFAVFENNDQRLWSALRMSGERILRPLWEAGGLRGANTAEAYYITCDDTINTPAVIQSGEVRMEVGVALEYPAEFVVIRITQFDRGTFSAEVNPV
jgi:phage tail sheath protein FI